MSSLTIAINIKKEGIVGSVNRQDIIAKTGVDNGRRNVVWDWTLGLSSGLISD